MHIVFLTARYPPDVRGGGEVSTQLLAEALALAGEQVTVVCGHDQDTEESVRGVRVCRRKHLNAWKGKPLAEAPASRRLAGRLASVLSELSPRPDVLHAQEFRSALSLSVLSHPKRVVTIRDFAPICGTTNNMWWDGSACTGCFWPNVLFRCHRVAEASIARKPFRVWQYKGNLGFRLRAFRNIPRHVYGSHALRKRVEDRLQPPAGVRSSVIPNAVDPGWLAEPPAPFPEMLVLCSVGRLETTKGTDVLLSAFAEVQREIPEAKLRFVGGGEIPRYAALAQRLGLARAVTFHGPVAPSAVQTMISSSSIVVSPHLWEEPFGRSALEAGACGRPLVASDLGGVRETTTKETAILVLPRDSVALSQALLTLARTKGRAMAMGQAARRHVSERFHPAVIAERHQELYHAL